MGGDRVAVGLTVGEVDRFLLGLGEAVMAMRTEHAAAQRRSEQLDEELETWFGQEVPRIDGLLAADKALLRQRGRIADDAARRHREALRGLTAWWAFSAVVAVAAAANRREPDPVLLAAGNPARSMEPEELQQLPPIGRHDRNLADLMLSMTGRPVTPDIPDAADFDDEAFEYFASVGLRVRTGPEGDPVLAEDGSPEARRCRLWGQAWQKHRMPLLFTADQLIQALEHKPVPAETIREIRAVADKTDALLAASIRREELEARVRDEEDMTAETEEAIGAEIDTLWEQALRDADDILVDFARTLTGHLPAIRT